MSISLEKAKETTNGSSHRTVRKHRLNRSPIQIESKWIKDVPYTLFPSFNKNRSLSPLKKQKQLRIAKKPCKLLNSHKARGQVFNLVTFIHHAQRNKLPTPYCAYLHICQFFHYQWKEGVDKKDPRCLKITEKSLIQYCDLRAKRATFTFWVDKRLF